MSDDFVDGVNRLDFQYQLRTGMLDGLQPEERRVATEQRDRELEDYLGKLAQRIKTIEDTLDG